MPFDTQLADKVRDHLMQQQKGAVEEKQMFGGLAFMVNGKMCINVSSHNLMCRFDPALTEQLSKRKGYLPMMMKGKELKGYCYVEPAGFSNNKEFEFWISLCLDFNKHSKAKKKK